MASTNFKLFDENKTNMMSDTEYNINTQRLNGVQAGIASSQLQNKTLYQASLVAYSLAQIMMQNGYDANDSAAVSAFVGNMSNSLLQKVLDKATSAEAKAGTVTNKWISPATMKAAALLLSGGTMSGPINMGNNKITNLADPISNLDAANKKYVDGGMTFKKIKVVDNLDITFPEGTGPFRQKVEFDIPQGYQESDLYKIKMIQHDVTYKGNVQSRNLYFGYDYSGSRISFNIISGISTSILFNSDYIEISNTTSSLNCFVGQYKTLMIKIIPNNKPHYYLSSNNKDPLYTVTSYIYI